MLAEYGQIPGSQIEVALYVKVTLFYVSSSLNPILYCWKITSSVRQATKNTIKQLNCCKSAWILGCSEEDSVKNGTGYKQSILLNRV